MGEKGDGEFRWKKFIVNTYDLFIKFNEETEFELPPIEIRNLTKYSYGSLGFFDPFNVEISLCWKDILKSEINPEYVLLHEMVHYYLFLKYTNRNLTLKINQRSFIGHTKEFFEILKEKQDLLGIAKNIDIDK